MVPHPQLVLAAPPQRDPRRAHGPRAARLALVPGRRAGVPSWTHGHRSVRTVTYISNKFPFLTIDAPYMPRSSAPTGTDKTSTSLWLIDDQGTKTVKFFIAEFTKLLFSSFNTFVFSSTIIITFGLLMLMLIIINLIHKYWLDIKNVTTRFSFSFPVDSRLRSLTRHRCSK